uniref:Uncharacterized protein n=1 Tax=Anguilla anguilla TaxID=7936 RepID=A0A0E9TWE4_ANGAN
MLINSKNACMFFMWTKNSLQLIPGITCTTVVETAPLIP